MIQPVERPGRTRCRKGSKASSSPRPTVGDVRGLEGFYHYRQYNAVELAEKRPLEDVWYLLFEGALPDDARRARRVRRPRSRRCARSPTPVADVLPAIAARGRDVRAARRAAHRGVAARRRRSASSRRSTSTHADAARQRDADVRGRARR